MELYLSFVISPIQIVFTILSAFFFGKLNFHNF